MRAQRSQRKNKTAPICGDGSTKCRWDPDGDLFMDSDGVVHAKPLGSRLHALYAARGTDTAPSGRRRGAVLLHGAARTFVLAPVHGAVRAHVVESFADSLGAPCDVFAAVSLYDERTARPRRAEASAFRNASRSQLLRALHALSPASSGRRRPHSSIAWSMLHFDCAPPTRRFDEACTRSNKRAGFKHTPTMVIQATQIEAAYELLRREAAPRSVADAYDWVLRTRPDMWWAEPPRWTSLLASRVPKTYGKRAYTLCTDCIQLIPSEQAAVLLSPRSRVVCGDPDGSVVGSGGGMTITQQDREQQWRNRGPRTACCNHFEGFHTQCVLNGTASAAANWPAFLLRDFHYNVSCASTASCPQPLLPAAVSFIRRAGGYAP